MLYYDGMFYDSQGHAVAITSDDGLLTTFDNGATYMTCEIKNQIKNYDRTPAVRISNRIELERRREKYPIVK